MGFSFSDNGSLDTIFFIRCLNFALDHNVVLFPQ